MDGTGSGFAKGLEWLSATFPLGRVLGTRVRIYALALLLVPVIAVYELGQIRGVGGLEAWSMALLGTVALYVVVLTHEMGHVLMGRRFSVWTHEVTLSPLGGLAHMQAATGPRAEIAISLAGPLTHLGWLAVVWPLSLLVPMSWGTSYGWRFEPLSTTIDALLRLNIALALFNLLPFFPLDGGRVLRGILARKMHPNRASLIAARIGMVGAVGMMAYGLVRGGLGGGVLVAIGLSCLFSCLREVAVARWTEGPYGEPRAPWEIDPEAWKHGVRPPREVVPRKPGILQRVLRHKTPAPTEAPPTEEELDRLLARVSEVGVRGLTDDERKALVRSAQMRRHL